MDELITVKEEKVKKLEEQGDQMLKKLRSSDEDSNRCKALEEKLKFIEKQYNKDLQKLQSELNLYKKYQQSQLQQHDSNQSEPGSLMPTATITTATTCSSNQQVEKPLISNRGFSAGVHRNSQPAIPNFADYPRKDLAGDRMQQTLDNRE